MESVRIMVLADVPNRAIWDFFEPSRLKGIDLIISCGDLPAEYLAFISTFFNGDVLYVHGNHDKEYLCCPPGGCIDIEDRIYVYKGIRILGLGGSIRYKKGPYQYTQAEMHRRVLKLWFKLKKAHGIDILVTHSPAMGINDIPDHVHEGFAAFLELIHRYHPRYLIHGHVHMNYGRCPRISEYEGTTIINAYDKYIFEYHL